MNKRKKNYNFLSNYPFYTPGFKGGIILLLLFLAGALLGSIVSAPLALIYSSSNAMEAVMLVSYPIMFIPPMIYASLQSKRNSFFDLGYKLDSNNFGSLGPWKSALMAAALVLTSGFIIDITGYIMPDMPEWLESALNSMTGGNFWLDFICVSIFAPFFEEWLCRGMILRGLLNYKKEDGTNGIRPVWAIVISAAVFAAIHGNIWQALPAFVIGCVMGLIYYKTGSLKLTMLMHFVNNTLALVMSHIDSLSDYDYWIEIMGAKWYWIAFAACAILTFLIIRKFLALPNKNPKGGCDIIDPNEAIAEA
ncbi:MAG: CPBP family intramembrane metalloprotease [Bacteroidales bacterium]|nr:CPBP family intramembrane metalloprotease [Bacteroidales bacterium]